MFDLATHTPAVGSCSTLGLLQQQMFGGAPTYARALQQMFGGAPTYARALA